MARTASFVWTIQNDDCALQVLSEWFHTGQPTSAMLPSAAPLRQQCQFACSVNCERLFGLQYAFQETAPASQMLHQPSHSVLRWKYIADVEQLQSIQVAEWFVSACFFLCRQWPMTASGEHAWALLVWIFPSLAFGGRENAFVVVALHNWKRFLAEQKPSNSPSGGSTLPSCQSALQLGK